MRRLFKFQLYSRKAVIQIGNDIVDMLRTDGETDSILVDSRSLQLLVGELGVCCGGGVYHKRLYIRYICKQ